MFQHGEANALTIELLHVLLLCNFGNKYCIIKLEYLACNTIVVNPIIIHDKYAIHKAIQF